MDTSGFPSREALNAAVSETAVLSRGEYLNSFAYGRGIPWQLWTGSLTRRSTGEWAFGRALTNALENAKAIYFNITGMDSACPPSEAYRRGKAGVIYAFTRDRFAGNIGECDKCRTRDNYSESRFLGKTIFYESGKALPTKDVVRRALGIEMCP
ncbi:hypothetical protein VZQ01_36095 [Myxococcus faecalis]|uniref:hypothetical protein n=1 Tax=Myxococcus faecalis TaxID=3115646 RepID=UPI003CF920B7